MIVDAWREWLYFPLGFLPTLFFGSRWFIQWIQSEKRQSCYVGQEFWKLSLFGNLLFILHYIVQVQYHFAILQVINAVISWRNLNFLQATAPATTKRTILIALSAVLLLTLVFLAQSYFVIGELDWVRSPTSALGATRQHHSLIWHLVGLGGGVIFASRFWIQWWQMESKRQSELGVSFWFLSIFGSFLVTLYSIRIMDIVSLIHNAWAVVPCVRNLYFIRRAARALDAA